MYEKTEKEAKDLLQKYCRLELINNIGYIISTLIIVVGLFNFDVFLHFIYFYKIIIPIMTGVIFIILVYLVSQTFYWSSYIYSARSRVR